MTRWDVSTHALDLEAVYSQVNASRQVSNMLGKKEEAGELVPYSAPESQR